MGVSRFVESVICKFGLLVVLLGEIGGRPSHIGEWFVVRVGVGLVHIRLDGCCG